MIGVLVLAALFQAFTPPLRVIDHGSQSRLDDERFVVARDQAEWTAAWRAHAHARPVPSVDWSQEMVVGVFLGARNTAGYSVEIVGYRENEGGLVVGYRETTPGADRVTAQIITSPFALAAVPRRSGEVTFQKVNG